jgi:excisionase family DNA binding protein
MPGGKAGESPRLPGGLASRRAATEIPASTDVGNSPSEQPSAAPGVRQHRRGSRRSGTAVSEAADPVGQSSNAIARQFVSDMGEDLLAIMREVFARNSFERLAYSPDEAAELLGISRELVHDLLRTGQLGSVKAGRRRLIAKHHLEAFLAGEP